MAAPTLRKLGRAVLAILAGIALAGGLFVLAAWIGSSIPRNTDWREPDAGITILVETNGTHTGIVMPIVTPVKDWRTTFPSAASARGGRATHIAVGWGEREVFLDVPTWSDLSPFTALRILTAGGESVMRVSHYVRPAPGEYHRPLRITREQYATLAELVEQSLAPPPSGGRPEILQGNDPLSAYYPALGRYTIVRTSNTWTGDMLGDAGVRMGWWAPFAGGVMKWVPEPVTGQAEGRET